MMRFLVPILLVAAAVVSFVTWTNPTLSQIKELQIKEVSYDEALDNARDLREAKERLLAKSNSFHDDDLAKIEKMVPNAVDNIGLVYEMEILASQYGIQLENAKFEPISEDQDDEEGSTQVSTRRPAGTDNSLYDTFDLEFSMQGSYANFVLFLSVLEKSLRIVDVKTVTFNSGSGSSESDAYRYNIVLSAYRLRN